MEINKYISCKFFWIFLKVYVDAVLEYPPFSSQFKQRMYQRWMIDSWHDVCMHSSKLITNSFPQGGNKTDITQQLGWQLFYHSQMEINKYISCKFFWIFLKVYVDAILEYPPFSSQFKQRMYQRWMIDSWHDVCMHSSKLITNSFPKVSEKLRQSDRNLNSNAYFTYPI